MRLRSVPSTDKLDAFILHVDDDYDMACEIQAMIMGNDHTCDVYSETFYSHSITENFVRGIQHSKRVILIVSTAFLKVLTIFLIYSLV